MDTSTTGIIRRSRTRSRKGTNLRILVTGAKGQLGSELVPLLAGHEVFAADKEELDISDYHGTLDGVNDFVPDIVIHAAAYTNVDGCEQEPDNAYLVNAIGTQNVALACRKVNASMLYVSTDFVFDGSKGSPYTEFDDPNPLCVYGRSKLAGERYVRSILSDYYIARTAWVFGKNGHNFVKTILRLSEERGELTIVDDQFGSPTYAADLAAKIVEIALSGQYGLYHTVNQGSCSWHQLTKDILELAGRNDIKVTPISSASLNRPAPRPAYSVLDAMSLRLRGFSPMRPYSEALADFFVPA